jgi:hypothetical protein
MRESLADNLNLTGTACYNLSVRHKLWLARIKDSTTGVKTLGAWETVVSYYNHLELEYVNDLARAAGVANVPFQDVEPLVADTGERFFSEYLTWLKQEKPVCDVNDLCVCVRCSVNGLTVPQPTTPMPSSTPPPATPLSTIPPSNVPPAEVNTLTNHTFTNNTQQPAHPPAPFVLPMMWINLYFLPFPNWQHCCERYKEYCSRLDRRGRPPHDACCAFKRSTNL